MAKSGWDTGCPSREQVLFGITPRNGCQAELPPDPIRLSALPLLFLMCTIEFLAASVIQAGRRVLIPWSLCQIDTPKRCAISCPDHLLAVYIMLPGQ
jgi:hypothetical protein